MFALQTDWLSPPSNIVADGRGGKKKLGWSLSSNPGKKKGEGKERNLSCTEEFPLLDHDVRRGSFLQKKVCF